MFSSFIISYSIPFVNLTEMAMLGEEGAEYGEASPGQFAIS
jgi:hypothetical protein